MSDIDILLFHEAYQESEHAVKLRKKSLPISLETEIILPLTQKGVIACSLSSGPEKWQGIARIPSSDESDGERLSEVENLEGRFKRLDIR
jgi:DNA polymerase beta